MEFILLNDRTKLAWRAQPVVEKFRTRLRGAGCIRREHGILAMVVLTGLVFSGAAMGQTYYQWEDECGIVHLTNNLGKVPEQYRTKLNMITLRGSRKDRSMSKVSDESAGPEMKTAEGEVGESAGAGDSMAVPIEGEMDGESESKQTGRAADAVLTRQIERLRQVQDTTTRSDVREAVEKAIRKKEQELALLQLGKSG